MMAAENHVPGSFIQVPYGKTSRRSTDVPMVLNSLTTTVPFAAPFVLEETNSSSRSAPSSPVREEKQKKGFWHRRPHSPRPKSPLRPHTYSDPERSPSPNIAATGSTAPSRPKWLVFRKNHRRKKSKDVNGDGVTPVDSSGSIEDITRTLEPVATPADELPGQPPMLMKSNSGSTIPVITVTHGEENNISASLDDITTDGSTQRKLSQSSHSSCINSAATSGVGSLLGEGDGMESPISPLSSRTSSFSTEQVPCDLSDLELMSPASDQETVITPNTPPPSLLPDGNPRSPTEKEVKPKKKKGGAWDNLKKAVRAWSPFAIQFNKKRYPWVQLAGHQGNFMPGDESGTIMKKSDANERKALQALMSDNLRTFVPEFKKVIEKDGHMYVEMTDLLREYEDPAVMDIKMGLRTYLEEELLKKNLRADMYQKMIEVDPNQPTESEHAQKAITKPRYMQWRESLSSSSTLGFRVEGIKTSAGKALKDFKETKAEEDVVKALSLFLEENPSVKGAFLKRLIDIKAGLEASEFFKSHELIGSSLLFVYDSTSLCSIHMIDFGKTVALPAGVTVDHRTQWREGNHEDGYLLGLENLIRLWEQL